MPNREGVTIHVSGRAANVLDEECAYALSPLTRWTITGATGTALDTDVPGQPVFGLYPIGAGSIEVLGIAFSDLTNTRSISAGTLTLAYWDELQGPSTILLSAAMGDDRYFIHRGDGRIGVQRRLCCRLTRKLWSSSKA